MRFFSIFIISLLSLSLCEDDFPVENDVIILTDSTFDKAVAKYDYLLVNYSLKEKLLNILEEEKNKK